MEKMNQVSVSEFMSKSKEEMYDMAVEMVEKYNRLVDICNDSSERMAELMAKDDINEFKKELQSREPGELKIQKLADIVVWADGIIRDAGYNEEKYKNDCLTAHCHVKAHELWRIRDVALKSIERHTVYANALNKDISDKASTIERLEKEIEGRKEGYTALKELMDTKYISIDKHKKEIEEITKSRDIWFETAGTHSATILHKSEEINKLKEEIKKLNKCIMNKNGTINTAYGVMTNLHKEISAHEEENKKLEKRIEELKKERDKHMARVNDLRMELDCVKASLKNHNKRDMALVDELADKNDEIKELKEELDESYKAWDIDSKNDEIKELKDEIYKLRKELDESYKAWDIDSKNHQKREMTLVDGIAKKNQEIKELKEENSYLKSELKQKQNVIKKSYERYSDEILKTRKELMEVAYHDIEKDNGYIGFKLYVKNTLREAKGNKEEANEVITNAVKFFYREWDKEQKENEKTIEKAINEVKSKRGTPDIPCGEDAIE